METKALEKKVEFLTDCWYVAALSSEVPAEGMLYEAKRAGRNRLVSEQIQTADG